MRNSLQKIVEKVDLLKIRADPSRSYIVFPQGSRILFNKTFQSSERYNAQMQAAT